MKRTVVIVATLDTKGEHVAFVRGILTELDVDTVVVDAGILSEPRTRADITRDQVAAAAGLSLSEISLRGRKGVVLMADGATRVVLDLYRQGRVDGVMGMGGGQNTAIASTVMQALPLGVPKLIVSTVASGRMSFGPYVGTKDITLMHSVADVAGNNAIISRVLAACRRERPEGRVCCPTGCLDDVVAVRCGCLSPIPMDSGRSRSGFGRSNAPNPRSAGHFDPSRRLVGALIHSFPEDGSRAGYAVASG